jgi:hypothetical protein
MGKCISESWILRYSHDNQSNKSEPHGNNSVDWALLEMVARVNETEKSASTTAISLVHIQMHQRSITGCLHYKRANTHQVCLQTRVSHTLNNERQKCSKCTNWKCGADVEDNTQNLFPICDGVFDVAPWYPSGFFNIVSFNVYLWVIGNVNIETMNRVSSFRRGKDCGLSALIYGIGQRKRERTPCWAEIDGEDKECYNSEE